MSLLERRLRLGLKPTLVMHPSSLSDHHIIRFPPAVVDGASLQTYKVALHPIKWHKALMILESGLDYENGSNDISVDVFLRSRLFPSRFCCTEEASAEVQAESAG